MIRTIIFAGLLILAVGGMTACQQKSQYEKLVEKELASGERNDSLFLGLRLGMSSKEFYQACWEMNKQGLVRQGTRNTTVVYQLGDQLPYSAVMDFYPKFMEDKIVEMPLVFRYDAWSPWNRRLWSDSLQLDVLHLMEDWYGEGFIRSEHPEKGVAFVKVDGNRRIAIVTPDEQLVKVLFTDMSVDIPRPELPLEAAKNEGEE